MSGPDFRTPFATPIRSGPPDRRRMWIALFCVALVSVAAAALLYDPGAAPDPTAASPDSVVAARASVATVEPTAAATPAPASGSPESLTGYAWPLVGPVVTLPFGPSPFGEWIVDGKQFHDGVDMATKCGDKVYAAHDGVVLAASRNYDDFMGWDGALQPYYDWLTQHKFWNSVPIVIIINDGDGYRSIYAHEGSVTVKPGQQVKAGDLIGYEGMTGLATGCHVHFGLFSPTDPQRFELDPGIVSRDHLPAAETARIDPLLVLPFRCEIDQMRSLRPGEASPCPIVPTFVPTLRATAAKKATATPKSSPTEPVAPGA
jgi:murein DD-endopeptidase MepM/ murein hydrolase activator NlpD